MQLASIVDLIASARGTQWPILLGTRKLSFLIKVQLISAFLNLLFSILIVGFTSSGIKGILYATIVINLFRLPLLIWHVSSVCKITFSKYLSFSYLKSMLCLIWTFGFGFLCSNTIEINDWISLTLNALMISFLWLIAVFFLGLSHSEKSSIINKIKKLKHEI